MELTEDMNRAGRSAFDGNAAKVAPSNQDVPMRARKESKKKEEDEPPPGTPGD